MRFISRSLWHGCIFSQTSALLAFRRSLYQAAEQTTQSTIHGMMCYLCCVASPIPLLGQRAPDFSTLRLTSRRNLSESCTTCTISTQPTQHFANLPHTRPRLPTTATDSHITVNDVRIVGPPSHSTLCAHSQLPAQQTYSQIVCSCQLMPCSYTDQRQSCHVVQHLRVRDKEVISQIINSHRSRPSLLLLYVRLLIRNNDKTIQLLVRSHAPFWKAYTKAIEEAVFYEIGSFLSS